MNRKDIGLNIGSIVAYTDRTTGDVHPAKILDSRLWELYYRPGRRVRASDQTRASRVHKGCIIGYPVLMPTPGEHRSPEQDRDLMRWLTETTITMADLFDERGVAWDPPRWAEIERVFFTVVFPEDTRENFPGVARETREKKAVQEKRLKELLETAMAARDVAVRTSNMLAAAGFTSPDKLSIISHEGVKPSRLSVPMEILEETVRIALPLMNGCERCGTHDFLLPHDSPDADTVMLCAGCHPRCF